MNTATVWLILLIAVLHIVLALSATVFLIKDQNISLATKCVHGLLAWLVPVIGCLFSTHSFLGTSGGRNIIIAKHTQDHPPATSEFDGD